MISSLFARQSTLLVILQVRFIFLVIYGKFVPTFMTIRDWDVSVQQNIDGPAR